MAVHPAILRRRINELGWADKTGRAEYALDFTNNQARWNSASIGALANTPNWTFTRASTAYYRNSSGLLTSVASGVLRTGDRGALIEGAGTNLCLQSQTFDNAFWVNGTRVTRTANTTTAPDGTTTADTIAEDASAAASHDLRSSAITVSSGVVHTFSVYLKKKERSQVVVRCGSSANDGARFNLNTGVVEAEGTAGNATITALTNGWYRCAVKFTTPSTSEIFYVGLCDGSYASTSIQSYNGDGSSGIYAWGAQIEATAYASSYIPTTTASATRAADSLTVTGVSGLDYPLTLYAEIERAADKGAAEPHIGVSNTTNDYALLRTSNGDLSQGAVVTGGASQGFPAVGSPVMVVGTAYKHAMRVATNDLQIALNGTLGTPDASSTNPAAPTMIEFGSLGGSYGYAYLRRLAIFSRALSDAELQVMTS